MSDSSISGMGSRRAFLVALAGAPLAACNTTQMAGLPTESQYAGWYIGTAPDHPFPIPLVDRGRMRPEQRPTTVSYHGGERPGTVVVDIDQRFLYLVQGGGTALRYAVGVGRQGFSWKGAATFGRKAPWPNWSPTSTMVRINPKLQRYAAAGLRIHGTNEPWTIGQQVSSGCIRMLNEDVVDLYNRVPVGATVLVRRSGRYRV